MCGSDCATLALAINLIRKRKHDICTAQVKENFAVDLKAVR